MSFPQILRVSRADEPGSYVLLRICRVRSAALDLNIVGTEGESPYVGLVRQSHLKSLRAKNYQGTDDEWARTLSYVFGQLSVPEERTDWCSGVEVSASIFGYEKEQDNEMVLTIRKRIQTITQKLGSINLKQDDEQAIELFDWTGIALSRASTLKEQFSSLNDRCRAAEGTIECLNRQLEELISSKDHHENQLITNFVQLLNEKKLKIRNQQRLLASANVNADKVFDTQAAIAEGGRDFTQKNGRPKRNAEAMGSGKSEGNGEFEEMEVDQAATRELGNNQETDDERPSTPEPLEKEENGTTTDEESAPSPVQKENQDGGAQNTSQVPSSPPPRRELPFVRKPLEKRSTQPQLHDNNESTAGETDDDEL